MKIRVNPEGLGDTLANLTYKLGIDVTVKKITNTLGIEDCHCEKRQEYLNKLIPYKKKSDNG